MAPPVAAAVLAAVAASAARGAGAFGGIVGTGHNSTEVVDMTTGHAGHGGHDGHAGGHADGGGDGDPYAEVSDYPHPHPAFPEEDAEPLYKFELVLTLDVGETMSDQLDLLQAELNVRSGGGKFQVFGAHLKDFVTRDQDLTTVSGWSKWPLVRSEAPPHRMYPLDPLQVPRMCTRTTNADQCGVRIVAVFPESIMPDPELHKNSMTYAKRFSRVQTPIVARAIDRIASEHWPGYCDADVHLALMIATKMSGEGEAEWTFDTTREGRKGVREMCEDDEENAAAGEALAGAAD